MGLQNAFWGNFPTGNDHFEFNKGDQTAAFGNFLIEGEYRAPSQADQTNLTAQKSQAEEVTTGAAYTTSEVLDAIQSSLTAREIDTTEITDVDMAVFATAASLIAALLSSDIETTPDIEDMFGEDLNILLVDDFASLDGVSLNGAAVIGTDEIILDSGLEGDELRAVLAEEIAETAYQDVYGEASVGDFGAELVAILNGEDTDAIETYSETTEIDTVETEYGTAEANLNTSLETLEGILESELGWEINYSGSAGVDGYNADISTMYASNLDGDMWGETLHGTTASEIEGIAEANGTYDFDGDGIATSFVAFAVLGGSFAVENLGADITSYENLEYMAIDGLSSTLIAGSGSATFEYWLTEGETYTTGSEYSYSETISTSSGLSVSGIETSFSTDTTNTETFSSSNSFTATSTIRNTYTVDGSDYEAGTAVSYGAHAAVADATIADKIELLGVAYDYDDDGYSVENYFYVDATETEIYRDYLIDVVQTDVSSADLLG